MKRLSAAEMRVLRHIARRENRNWETSEHEQIRRRRGATIIGHRKTSFRVCHRLADMGLIEMWESTASTLDCRRGWAKTTPAGLALLEMTNGTTTQ